MDKFITTNYGFVSKWLHSMGFKGHVSSVHFAPTWQYKGGKTHLKNKTVVGVVFDRFKNKWDFVGGKNESKNPDHVVQFLETLYKEVFEEMSAFFTAPLKDHVLHIIRCGHNERCFLVVCGIKGLFADRFAKALNFRHEAVQRGVAVLPSFLETTGLWYLSYDDAATRAASTEYVQGKLQEVIGISDGHRLGVGGRDFPAFDNVMAIQHGFRHAVHSNKEVMYFL